MPLVFISMRRLADVPVPFPNEIELCEEEGGVVSHLDIMPLPSWSGWDAMTTMTNPGALGELTRYSLESRNAILRVHGLLGRQGYRAVSANALRDRGLLRALWGLVGAECPAVLDLAEVQRMALISIFRDRPDMMPGKRVMDEMISQSAEAELYRQRERGPEPDDASSAWWRWRDVQSRARVMKMGFST